MEVNNLENEQWKDIPGYEGIYQASTLGRIRTCENKTTYTERHGVRHWKQRILKQKYQRRYRAKENGKRDARVCLWKDGKEKTHLVSRLVAMTWCDGYSEELTVNHIDGDTENNNASNLEWVTYKENSIHSFRTGLHASHVKPIILTVNGNNLQFNTLASASRFLGYNSGYLSNKFKKEERKRQSLND